MKLVFDSQAQCTIFSHELNVVCATRRRSADSNDAQFHIPVNGKAVLVVRFFMPHGAFNGISTDVSILFFKKSHKVMNVRNGLDGTALVIGLERHGEKYDILELYTDTPLPYFGKWEISSTQIAEKAKQAVMVKW